MNDSRSTIRDARSTRRGFTLIELMVVLCIMAILAMMAQPRLARTIQRDRVRRAGQKLAADARLLQSEAVRMRTQTALGINPGADFYALWYFKTSTANWKPLDYLAPRIAGLTSFAMDADYKVAIDRLASGATTIKFDRYGMPGSDETVTLGLGKLRIDVAFEAGTGNVSVGSLYEAGTSTYPTQTAWPDDTAMKGTAPS